MIQVATWRTVDDADLKSVGRRLGDGSLDLSAFSVRVGNQDGLDILVSWEYHENHTKVYVLEELIQRLNIEGYSLYEIGAWLEGRMLLISRWMPYHVQEK